MSSSCSATIGVDIGGAHLKAADLRGKSYTAAFPLWQRPADLAQELGRLVEHFVDADDPGQVEWVITMTGELADCFVDRAAGVRHIVEHCVKAFGPACRFYSVEGRFLAAAKAVQTDQTVAASNWHAMASVVARWYPGDGVVIDIGSTTTDVIPFRAAGVATTSQTDHDRLLRGELLYAGVGRTPICSLVDALPFGNELVPVMNEVFAVTDDCALLTGLCPESSADTQTCDGRPRTRDAARNRMARMIGLDHRQVTMDDAVQMAFYVWQRLQAQWLVAARMQSTAAARWVLVGHGQALIPVPDDHPYVDLAEALGAEISRVGPAFAVACLCANVDSIDQLAFAP